MRQLKQNEPIDVGLLLQQMTASSPSVERFRFTCTAVQAADILKACYIYEVKARGRECTIDEPTTTHIRRLAEWITDPDDPRFGVRFCGLVGSGKTTLMYALARAIAFMCDDDPKEYRTLRIIDAKDADPDKHGDIPMLAIDDLGTEPLEVQSYGNIATPVIDLLYRRYKARLFTAFTTNLADKRLRERYGDRIGDRINEMCFPIPFTNPTYRSPVDINAKLKKP